MDDWTEANLVKLSVKELKSLARKSNVNPNSKKAELVKALLTNVKNTADESETNEGQMSRRMTRSRVSIWQSSDGTTDHLKKPKAKVDDVESNLNPDITDSVHDKRSKKKREITVENIDSCDTAEMFPLVSSIQLISKPLLEITNKDVVRKNIPSEQEDEFKTAAPKTKNTKKKKAQNKSTLDFPSSGPVVNNGTTDMQTSFTDENNEQTDCDLNSTFIVEGKGCVSQHVNKGSKKRKVGTEHTNEEKNTHSSLQSNKLIANKSTNNNNDLDEIEDSQQGAKSSIENKSKTEKPKRGKKRKPDSPLGNEKPVENTSMRHVRSPETSDSVSSTCVSHIHKSSSVKPRSNDFSNSKRRTSETSPVLEKSDEDLQDESKKLNKASKTKRRKGNTENEGAPTITTTQNIEHSINKCSSDEIITYELVQTSDSGVAQNKIISNFDKTKLNNSKKRKRTNRLPQKIFNNNLESSFEETDVNKSKRKKCGQTNETNILANTNSVDNKQLRGKKTKQGLSLESENSKAHEITKSVETTNNSPGFRKSPRRSRSLQKFETESSVVNVNINDPVLRSPSNKCKNSHKNIIDDKNNSSLRGETGEKSVQMPVRSSTFILSDMAVGKNSPSLQSVAKHGKSIGSRIMQTSVMKRANEKCTKKDLGSTLKKAITKVSTPGSVFKKRPTNKMPDFKKIHQQLFNNMESLDENKKRQLNRAHGLLQSPIVPRCAVITPKLKVANPESSPLKKEFITKVKSPMVHSPLAIKLKTPAAQTTIASLKPVPGPPSVNRFGFRRPLKKEEASSIIGKKLPSLSMGKKKDEQRNLLHGVRMNKRFMLQMQMRQNAKGSEK